MVLPWYRHCHKLHEIKNYFVKTKPVRILSCGIAVAALRKENVFKKDGKLFSNKDHIFENFRQVISVPGLENLIVVLIKKV